MREFTLMLGGERSGQTSLDAPVDEYCRTGDLLTLERDKDDRRLFDWTMSELVAQYEGGEPTAWPGPF